MTADDAPGAVTICERGRRGLYADDLGVTLRECLSRPRRFAWAEISRFADGRGVRNDSPDAWKLLIVLRTGRRVPVSCAGEWLMPQTLAALRLVSERYGIPAEVTGIPMDAGRPPRRGLYRDPGGQAGLRFWDGGQWSPLLPADVGTSQVVLKSAASWSGLPVALGGWAYPGAAARRSAVWCGVLAVVSAVLVAVPLVAELWWDGAALHSHLDGIPLLLIAFGGLAALFARIGWRDRKFYMMLDAVANSPASG